MYINPSSLQWGWRLGEDTGRWLGVVSRLIVWMTVIACSGAVCAVMALVVEARSPKHMKEGKQQPKGGAR